MFRVFEAVKGLVAGKLRRANKEADEPEPVEAFPPYYSRTQYKTGANNGKKWRRAYSSWS